MAIVVALVVAVCGQPVIAAAQDKETLSIASVDLNRIQRDYLQPNSVPEGLRSYKEKSQRFLDQLRNTYSYLSEERFKDIVEILQMPRPLSAEAAKRRDELADVSAKNEKRFLELQAMTDRSTAEQDEFERLQEAYENCQDRIKKTHNNLQGRLQQQQQRVIAKLQENVIKAAKQIATQNGYDLVLSNMVVLYGADDITDDVLQELTGRVPEAKSGQGPEVKIPAPQQKQTEEGATEKQSKEKQGKEKQKEEKQ